MARWLVIALVALAPSPAVAQWDAGVPTSPAPDPAPDPALAPDPGPDTAPDPDTAPTPDPAPDPAPDPDPTPDPPPASATAADTSPASTGPRFVFGSYGRVSVASDLDGHTGRDSDIVSQSPRIDEGTYAELELRREDDIEGMSLRIVATLAVAGPLFHFDGDFEERLAIRNLFAEVDDALVDGLALWVGSRMARGDDVYLLDFWPLDDLNMVGGGARYTLGEVGQLAVHAGLARPNDPFQLQVDDVVAPSGFVPDEVVVLDRPRLVLAAKATWWALGRAAPLGLKLVLYGESHILPAGERERRDGGSFEQLPGDSGWVLGGQAGGWLAEMNAHVNLFLRYARGLAAYDPLGVPFRVGSVIATGRADELLAAVSASWEWEMLGLQLGGYVRRFRDADPNLFERGQLAEGAIVARPHVWLGRHVGIAAEASYQALETTALDERSGQPVAGSAVKLGLIPYFTPYGRGTYTRPHLRLIYAVTLRDEGARALYPEEDARSRQSTEHFFGAGAEWWFDSSSY